MVSNGAVATRDDKQRQQEAQENLHPHQGHIPGMIRIVYHTGLHAEHLKAVSVPQIQDGACAGECQEPHHDAREPGTPGVSSTLGAERSHNGQVAVHAHARDEEDRGVKVEVVECSADFAGDPAEGPVVPLGVIDGPQWEGQQEQQVGHTQVQHEGVCYSSP